MDLARVVLVKLALIEKNPNLKSFITDKQLEVNNNEKGKLIIYKYVLTPKQL